MIKVILFVVILLTNLGLLTSVQAENKYEKSQLVGKTWVAQMPEGVGVSISLTFSKDSVVQKFGSGTEEIVMNYGYYLADQFDKTDYNWNLIGKETAGDHINMNRHEKTTGFTRNDPGFLKIVSLTDKEMVIEYNDNEEMHMTFVVQKE